MAKPNIRLTGYRKTPVFEEKKEVFKYCWQWILYLFAAIPAFLFALAYFTGSGFFSRMFHTYSLYIANPVPNFQSYTGVAGFVITMYFLFMSVRMSVRNKNWLDLVLTIFFIAVNISFFKWGLNYTLLSYLTVS